MIELDVATRIDRPIDVVYAFASDPANRSRWDRSVLSEELTSAGPLALGSTIHTRMRVLGQDSDMDWRIDEFSPPHALGLTSTVSPLAMTTRMTLAEAGSATDLAISVEAHPEGMMRLASPIIEQAIRRDLTTALGRLKDLLESGT